MPPVCSFCKEVGHSLKRCSKAPVTCINCNSTSHGSEACPRVKTAGPKRRQQKNHSASGLKDSVNGTKMVYVRVSPKFSDHLEPSKEVLEPPSIHSQFHSGEHSGLYVQSKILISQDSDSKDSEKASEAEADSSNTLSSDRDEGDCGEEVFEKFQKVLSKRQRKVQRGKSLKSTL